MDTLTLCRELVYLRIKRVDGEKDVWELIISRVDPVGFDLFQQKMTEDEMTSMFWCDGASPKEPAVFFKCGNEEEA